MCKSCGKRVSGSTGCQCVSTELGAAGTRAMALQALRRALLLCRESGCMRSEVIRVFLSVSDKGAR